MRRGGGLIGSARSKIELKFSTKVTFSIKIDIKLHENFLKSQVSGGGRREREISYEQLVGAILVGILIQWS